MGDCSSRERNQNDNIQYTELDNGFFIVHVDTVGYYLADKNKERISEYFCWPTGSLQYTANLLNHVNKIKNILKLEQVDLPTPPDQMTDNEFKLFLLAKLVYAKHHNLNKLNPKDISQHDTIP